MNRSYIIFAIAAVLAVSISLASKPVPLEQKLIGIHAVERLGEFPDIEQAPIELQAALADMAHDPLLVLKAKAAMLRYRAISLQLLPLYGSEPQFQKVLREYGEPILPAIHYFVSNPVGSIEWMNKAGNQYEAIKSWFANNENHATDKQHPTVLAQSLTPTERGWRAIQYIEADGHDFIGQFVVNSQGNVEWLFSERVMEGVTQFFASGLRQLEKNYKMDEEIRAADIGWATLDVLVFASAVKVLRVGRNAAVSTQGASAGTRSAALTARAISGGRLVLSGVRYAKWPIALGGAYLVITHPSLINDVLAELASVVGVPALLVQFFGWLLLLVPVLFILRTLLWFIMPVIVMTFNSITQLLSLLSGRKAL